MAQDQPCPIPPEMLEAAALWYRGGYTVAGPFGYILEYNPFHPRPSKRGLVAQHRLVMERHLGRILLPEEVVHHKDEDRSNNDIENLELFACNADHMRHHHQQTAARYDADMVEKVRIAAADPTATVKSIGLSPTTVRQICSDNGIEWKRVGKLDLTDDQVREALQGRTVAEAAIVLRVSFQTLYGRFGHLLTKRRTPGFLDPHLEEVCTIAKEKGIQAVARKFDTTHATVYQAIARWKKAGLISGDVKWRGKPWLDEIRKEAIEMMAQVGISETARRLGRTKGALQFALKRWSETGDLPDGFVPLQTRRKHQKPLPERKGLVLAASSPEQSLVPPAS